MANTKSKKPAAKKKAPAKKKSNSKEPRHNSRVRVEGAMREMMNSGKVAKKIGRPCAYTEELGAEICLRICEGESLNSIVRDKHMPAKSTVIRWAMFANDPFHFSDEDLRERLSIFSDHYAYARMVQAENLVDQCTDISDDGSNDWMEKETKNGSITVIDHEVVNRSKLRVETRKWLGEVYLPKIQAMRKRELELTNKKPIVLQFDGQDEEA